MIPTGKKNLFIIFAPGLGGNHLANIISLDQQYQTRFYLDRYKNTQILENAHFSSVRNLELDSIKNNLDSLKDKNNVFCSHLAQYQWFAESEYSKYFENKQFICISMPSTNARAQQRLQRYHSLLKNEYFFYEFDMLYSLKYLSLIFNEHDWFLTSADLLFNDDINELLDKLSEQGLNLTLDRDLAQNLHTQWVNHITQGN